MGAYLYLAKMKLMAFLTYRFEVITSLGTNLIALMASVFLWKTAYSGTDAISGVTESQMLTYTIISVLLSSFFSSNIEHSLQERIAQGNIALDFLKPINLIFAYLSEDIGISMSSVVSKLIPVLIISALFVQVPLPGSWLSFLVFLISSMLSYLILWLISALIAVLCFWTVQLGELKTVKDGIILLISGKIIPIWMFPKWMQKVLSFMPFQYVYQTPLSIYINRITRQEIAFSLFIQAIWVLFLSLALIMLWNKARKHVFIQGG